MEHSKILTYCRGLCGMAYAVDPDISHKKAMRTIDEAKSDIVTYCASCRGNLAAQGAHVLPLLDLIFEDNWQEEILNPPVEPSAALDNQKRLRSMLLERSQIENGR